MLPPGVLWRSALSMRLATSSSTSLGSPVAGAARRLAWIRMFWFSASCLRPVRMVWVIWARSNGSQTSTPRSLVASVRRALTSRSWCWPRARAFWHSRPEGLGVSVGVGERDFEQGLEPGEGGAQFVGGVGDEVTLGLEGGFEAAEEVVEGLAKLGQFVGWPVEAEATVEVGGGDLACGGVHGAQRSEEPAGDPPGQSERDDPGDQGHHQRPDVEVLAEEGVVGAGAAVDVGRSLPDQQAADGEDRDHEQDEAVRRRGR